MVLRSPKLISAVQFPGSTENTPSSSARLTSDFITYIYNYIEKKRVLLGFYHLNNTIRLLSSYNTKNSDIINHTLVSTFITALPPQRLLYY